MSKALSSLAVGTLVKDVGTLYNGKPIVWKIVDKNHSGYPSGAITLMTDKIISLKCFDAIEANNSDNTRKQYGNSRYIYSNIRQWLNSQAAAGSWYAAQHGQDAPPDNANVQDDKNEYDAEAGFLAGFSADMRSALMTTNLTVAKNTVTDGGGSEACVDKIFLPSTTEMGLANENGIAEGSKFAAFDSGTSRLAYPTAECVSKSEYTNTSLNTSAPWYYWLRTLHASYSYNVRVVYSSGVLISYSAYYSYMGVRPLCNLSSEILVSDTADTDGVYTIIFNQSPTPPNGITVPTIVNAGESINILWGQSTDSDGTISAYILERKVDSGSFAQIYSGAALTHADSIASGWAAVQYRVKAIDSGGAESTYTTSEIRTVVNNTAPTISGTDSNLGDKSASFTQSYTVDDADASNALTVVEKVNGTEIRTINNAVRNQEYTTDISSIFGGLSLGAHTLQIVVTDGKGGTATRTYTFTKVSPPDDRVEFTLKTPVETSLAAKKIVVSGIVTVPAGATLTVSACNNGFDVSPTWEDITDVFLGRKTHAFTNSTKTDGKWGINLKFLIMKNTATDPIEVKGFGFCFE